VAKFGGGCLRNAEDFQRVAEILKQEHSEPTIVVVSAIFGVTDVLHNSTRFALNSEDSIPLTIRNLKRKHYDIIETAISDFTLRSSVRRIIDEKMQKLERLLYGVAYTSELTESVRVLILSQGERLSATVLSFVLQDCGMKSESLESDIIGLLTDDQFENATADLIATQTNLQQRLLPMMREGVIPVVTGFFGCNASGQSTSFGRNGSDYSAAVIAYAVDASSLDIWKDVNGFHTTDPKITENAVPIKLLSIREAAELSYFGAKILHPRTMEPLRDADMTIRVRNIHSPLGYCTTIKHEAQYEVNVIKSIACNSNISILKIYGAGVGYKPGIIGEIGLRMAQVNVNIYSVITSQTCINLLIDRCDSLRSMSALNSLIGGVIGRIDVTEDVALIAVVGEGLLTTKGLAARVFTAVADSGVNVEMFSAGASEVAYYFIVQREDLEPAIQAVHRTFFEQS
jgi:aspartate kinase